MAGGRTIIRLRYPSRCATCGAELPPKSEAHWEKEARKATCRSCVEGEAAVAEPAASKPASGDPNEAPTGAHASAPKLPAREALSRGTAGASTAREWTRRHNRRERVIHDPYGRLAGLYLAFTDDPCSTRAWAIRSGGEVALGEFLSALDDDSSVIVLHDRRIPGTRATSITSRSRGTEFNVIDAKNYQGKVQRIDRGGWFSTDPRLYVGRRDCTKLISAMSKQVDAIRKAIGRPPLDEFDLKAKPSLCFVAAEWSLFAKPFEIDAFGSARQGAR